MIYELLRIDGDVREPLGEYDNYAEALSARCQDVLALLRDHDGWWTRAEHVIVGPGLDGPCTEHGLCTEIGVDRDRHEPPTADDLIDAEEWLTPLHMSSPQPTAS